MATIYEVLERDYARVRTLLEELHDTDPAEAKRRTALLAQVVEEVAAHSRAEQEIVYPVLGAAQEGAPAMRHALDDHGAIETALRDLVACDVHDELWMAKLEVLRESIDQYVEREHDEVFVVLRKTLDDTTSERLAEEFGRRKSVLTGHAA